MRLPDLSRQVLNLAVTVHRWLGTLTGLDSERREKVAGYAEEIAATLSRAAEALTRLEETPKDKAAARQAVRELGRISGYVETIVEALEHHLDGRKLAGVKKRLEQLATDDPLESVKQMDKARIERLVAAEGYFRALADGLRT